jgi:hypothetical protein
MAALELVDGRHGAEDAPASKGEVGPVLRKAGPPPGAAKKAAEEKRQAAAKAALAAQRERNGTLVELARTIHRMSVLECVKRGHVSRSTWRGYEAGAPVDLAAVRIADVGMYRTLLALLTDDVDRPGQGAERESLPVQTMRLGEDLGELQGSLRRALADGKLTREELVELLRAAQQLVSDANDVCRNLRAALDAVSGDATG